MFSDITIHSALKVLPRNPMSTIEPLSTYTCTSLSVGDRCRSAISEYHLFENALLIESDTVGAVFTRSSIISGAANLNLRQ
jgi:hypothetical protein